MASEPEMGDLFDQGARVLSVFGPFGSRTLVEMPTSVAVEVFSGGLASSSRSGVVEAVERDLAAIRSRSPEVADSGLAASAVALAYELEDPFVSATAKSMCAKALADAMVRLREWAPPVEEKDGLDELKARRTARRRVGGAAT